jgi:aspirochlorine biosynthesis cytochrome P450 monooxygenase
MVAHRSASRILVGEELCRDKVFVEASMAFIMSLFMTALIIVKLPLGALRNLLSWPLSLLHRRKLERCVMMLQPVVERRIRELKAGFSPSDHSDAIDWTLSLPISDSEMSPRLVALEIMHNLWAGSSAPGGLLTEMLFQLLMEPDYLSPLRHEAHAAIAEGGWTEKALNSLPLQDSFIREINRVYPAGSGV